VKRAVARRLAPGARWLTWTFWLLACGGSRPPARPAAVAAPEHPSPPAARSRVADEHAPARAHAFVTVGRRTIGPFAARTADAGIAAWVVGSARGSGQEVYAVPLGADGAPLAAPANVASVPDGVTSLVVRPAGGARGGWLVAWSALMDRGEALSVLSLDGRGAPRGAPAEVQRTTDHLAWFDVIPSAKGTLCAWAEETASGGANLLVVPVDGDGKAAGLPARVAHNVSRWQVVPGGAGPGLALVDAGSTDKPGTGRLTWERLDAEGHPQGTPLPVGAGPTVSSDVEAAALDDGWLLAWTDRTAPDAQVTLARVDASGRVQGPVQPLESAGSSAVVAMASGPQGVVLAWEAPRASAHPLRELHLASIARSGVLATQTAASLEIASKVAPELVATETGFALLAAARVCLDGVGTSPCAGPVAPTFVRLGPGLEPIQSEPILLGDGRAPAAIAWGLRCAGDHCSALAATGETPTSVFAVDLAPRTSPFAAPRAAAIPPDAPRTTGIQSVASGQPFADLAAARLGDVTLLAMLSLPASSTGRDARRKAPAGATISVRAIDPTGRPLSLPTTVSSRAVPVGGVGIAAAARPEDGAAIAWVKRDDGDPQVHVARVDQSGRRTREIQLTTAKGDASSVAVAAVDDGWLVAWVDGRDGSGEVYAAKLDFQLNRVGRDERITSAPGDAADVALAVAPGTKHPTAWLAWSDPRESPGEGLGDIYVTQLRPEDARRATDEVRLLATATHSRSPQIAPLSERENGGGALVAWVEDGPAGLDGPAAVMVAQLDGTAHLAGVAAKLKLPADGRPMAVALSAEDGPRGAVRAVVACASGDVVTLDAARIARDATPISAPRALLDLEAGAPFDAALALAGDALFFDDSGSAPTEHRVRRASIDWRR
jgi:hypothetical protein